MKLQPGAIYWLPILALDLGWTAIALYLADRGRHVLPFGAPIPASTAYLTPLVWGLVVAIWSAVFYLWGAYPPHPSDAGEQSKKVVLATTFAFFTFTSSLYLLKISDFSRLLFFYFYILDVAGLLVLRDMARRLLTRLRVPGYGVRRVVIVGCGEVGLSVARRLQAGPGYQVVGFIDDAAAVAAAGLWLPILGRLSDAEAIVQQHRVDEIVITPVASGREALASLILALQSLPVRLHLLPDLLEMVTIRTGIQNLCGVPVIRLREPAIAGMNRVSKRVLDVVVAVLGLIILAPFMAVIAVLTKLDSPGPVLFVQSRAGQYGRPFRIFKFRTMVRNAEELLGQLVDLDRLKEPVFKLTADPRVTRTGRWLRRTSLDELPQLLNVLKGEMSLVGPRPEELWLVEKYDPWQKQRLLVKPGMTGSMQVSGRANLSLDERVKLELAYIENYSLLEDIRILLRTVPAVLSGKGSY